MPADAAAASTGGAGTGSAGVRSGIVAWGAP
jgi:hypothetical protein